MDQGERLGHNSLVARLLGGAVWADDGSACLSMLLSASQVLPYCSLALERASSCHRCLLTVPRPLTALRCTHRCACRYPRLLNHKGFRVVALRVGRSAGTREGPETTGTAAALGEEEWGKAVGDGGERAEAGKVAVCVVAVKVGGQAGGVVRSRSRAPGGEGTGGNGRRWAEGAGTGMSDSAAVRDLKTLLGDMAVADGVEAGEEVWCLKMSAVERGRAGVCWLTDVLVPLE